MRLSKGKVLFLAMALAVGYGWQNLSRTAHEIVVLHFPDMIHQETYPKLWVVDDGQHLWLRGENSRRPWLEHLREHPMIKLHRRGQMQRYRAVVYNTANARAHVDPMFRAKYGLADEMRALTTPRETVPIRLEIP